MTSSMPWKRAPSCATGPRAAGMQLSYCLRCAAIRQTSGGSDVSLNLTKLRRIVPLRAAVVNTLGQPPQYQHFPDPVAAEGEAIVKVRAAGLHPMVKARASGTHYSSDAAVPFVPGVDGVGTLDDGSRVFFGAARAPFGSMAERTLVRRSMCVPLPDGLDDVQAAAIANPGMSAWVSMKERAGLAAGETVLVLGATGVAGQLAIQVARHLGAKRVIAVGRNVDAIAAQRCGRDHRARPAGGCDPRRLCRGGRKGDRRGHRLPMGPADGAAAGGAGQGL